ncbi:MAG: hypothetical protein F6K14_01570 [Symploca sp. SIO2C1]|nr:hypothetical protein [Symploca sp. SIO2C1]
MAHSFEEENRQDIETITKILEKITNLPAQQITPCLHTLMENLVALQEKPFYAQATPEEWSKTFTEWVECHRSLNLPSLSDEAISRDSIYGDER